MIVFPGAGDMQEGNDAGEPPAKKQAISARETINAVANNAPVTSEDLSDSQIQSIHNNHNEGNSANPLDTNTPVQNLIGSSTNIITIPESELSKFIVPTRCSTRVMEGQSSTANPDYTTYTHSLCPQSTSVAFPTTYAEFQPAIPESAIPQPSTAPGQQILNQSDRSDELV